MTSRLARVIPMTTPVRMRTFQRRPGLFARSNVIPKRADLADAALEKEVRKGLDPDGDFTRGELPEQPDFLTHWNVEWSEPPSWTVAQIFGAWALFFGGLLTLREIVHAKRKQNFYPIAAFRDELGDGYNDYGAEYVEERGINIAANDDSHSHDKHH